MIVRPVYILHKKKKAAVHNGDVRWPRFLPWLYDTDYREGCCSGAEDPTTLISGMTTIIVTRPRPRQRPRRPLYLESARAAGPVLPLMMIVVKIAANFRGRLAPHLRVGAR